MPEETLTNDDDDTIYKFAHPREWKDGAHTIRFLVLYYGSLKQAMQAAAVGDSPPWAWDLFATHYPHVFSGVLLHMQAQGKNG